jgi:toxin YhaV
LIRNGWHIYFLKHLFGKQRRDLQAEVRQLKKTLSPEDYCRHPKVKLYTAIMVAIKEKIPEDPFASEFALQGSLKKYGRVKKMGIPNRYRLFFRALQTPEHKAIFIIWLGYPRREGDRKDCYKIFTKTIEQGKFPQSIDELLLNSDRD